MEKWEFTLVKERRDTEYWIDTSGVIRKWKGSLRDLNDCASTHFLIAKKLFPMLDYPDDYVFELGWISIGSAASRYIKDPPTDAQIKTLKSLGRSRISDVHGIMYEF